MRRISLALALFAAAPALAQAPSLAQPPGIEVSAPWARPSVGAAKTGAAYMILENRGPSADRLLSATAAVAETVEIHTVVKDGDVMRMRPVAAIEIAAGETQKLQPGGFHIMLIGLKGPLKAGEHFPLELTFEKAGRRRVDVAIGTPPGAAHGRH